MSPRAARWALGALLAWAFLVRAFYAWPGAGPARFYDERFAVENIHHVLVTGRLEPVNGFHPTLSWMPTAGFLSVVRAGHRLAGAERDPFFDGRGRLTPAFYRWGRLFHVGLGVLSLYLVWRLGRRIAGRATGLIAAGWLALFPWHVRFSGILNEDMPQLVACELALLAILGALRSGSTRRFALAGAAIGAALATKFSAGPVALPLVVGAAGLRDRWSARLGKTALAAAVAAGALVACSPHLLLRTELYRKDFGITARLYETKGEGREARGRTIPATAVADLSGPLYFGTSGGLLVVAGLAAGLVAGRRRPRSWRRAAVAVGAYPALYVVVYGAASSYASPHNWLPAVPALAVMAAFGGRELVRLAARRSRPAAAAAVAVAIALPLGAAAWRSHTMVHEQAVPTCAERAAQAASQRLGRMRPKIVGVDPGLLRELGSGWQGRKDRLAFVELDGDGGERARRRWDAEIVAPERARDLERSAGQALEFRPSWLRLRGRPATLVWRRWEAVGPPLPVRLEAGRSGRRAIPLELPAVPEDATVSLTIHLRRRAARRALELETPVELRLGSGERLAFFPRRLPGGRALLIGERFRSSEAEGGAELRLPGALRGAGRANLQLWRWRRPGRGAGLSRPRSPRPPRPE